MFAWEERPRAGFWSTLLGWPVVDDVCAQRPSGAEVVDHETPSNGMVDRAVHQRDRPINPIRRLPSLGDLPEAAANVMLGPPLSTISSRRDHPIDYLGGRT